MGETGCWRYTRYRHFEQFVLSAKGDIEPCRADLIDIVRRGLVGENNTHCTIAKVERVLSGAGEAGWKHCSASIWVRLTERRVDFDVQRVLDEFIDVPFYVTQPREQLETILKRLGYENALRALVGSHFIVSQR